MTYQTAAAFRRALETRLAAESIKTATPLVRLRKLVTFDRLLARLLQADPGAWLLKGGLALQLRMGEHWLSPASRRSRSPATRSANTWLRKSTPTSSRAPAARARASRIWWTWC
jgi:predicted neuraminidase